MPIITDIDRDIARHLAKYSESSKQRSDLYVAANSNKASDDGPGSKERPLKSLGAAISRVNAYSSVLEPLVVHLASGTYTWDRTLGPVALQAPAVIIGDGAGQENDDGFTELLSATEADASSAQYVIKGTGFTEDEYQGKTIEVLSGASAGDRRTVRNNTTTDIIPCTKFSDTFEAGDEYRIVEPSVKILGGSPANDFGAGQHVHIQGMGTPSIQSDVLQSGGNQGPPTSFLMLANLVITDTDQGATANLSIFRISGSNLYLAGVELNGSEDLSSALIRLHTDKYTHVWSGYDSDRFLFQFRSPVELGLTDGFKSWYGWCLFGNETQLKIKYLDGILVWTDPRVGLVESEWWLLAGAIDGKSADVDNERAVLKVNTGAKFRTTFSDYPSDQTNGIKVLLRGNGSAPSACAMRVAAGGWASMNNIEIVLTGQGCGVVAGVPEISESTNGPGFGVVHFGRYISIEAPRVAYGASYGGRAILGRFGPDIVGTPSVSEGAVWGHSNVIIDPSVTFDASDITDGRTIVGDDPDWQTGISVSSDTVTLSMRGKVFSVEATIASSTGPKAIQMSASPTAGNVQVTYDSTGIPTLTFNSSDAVTECAVDIKRTDINPACVFRAH